MDKSGDVGCLEAVVLLVTLRGTVGGAESTIAAAMLLGKDDLAIDGGELRRVL